jgi:23S rRNA pseudouridine955/2504/2580 synthase
MMRRDIVAMFRAARWSDVLADKQPSRWGHVAASILAAALKTRSYAQMTAQNGEIPTNAPQKTALRTEVMGSEEAGQRVDKVLARLLPGVPFTRLFRLFRKGEVRLNGKRVSGEVRVAEGDVLRVPPVRIEAPVAQDAPVVPPKAAVRLGEQLGRAIIHEDERLLVINKPSGIAVHGGSGVSAGVIEGLRAARPDETLELVHRLDRDTSGCLLVARKMSTLRSLHAMLREDDAFDKRYLVLVRGKWELGRKRIDAPLRTDTRVGGERTVRVDAGGKEAASDFRVVQFFGSLATLLEVQLITGRTHQIRVHAAYAGHPVAGDEKYGDPDYNRQLRAFGLERLFLHAHSVSFEDPHGKGLVSVSAPLPPELHTVVDALTSKADKVKPAGVAKPGVAAARIVRKKSSAGGRPPPAARARSQVRAKRPAGAVPRTPRSAAGPRAQSGRASRSTRTGSRRGPRT